MDTATAEGGGVVVGTLDNNGSGSVNLPAMNETDRLIIGY